MAARIGTKHHYPGGMGSWLQRLGAECTMIALPAVSSCSHLGQGDVVMRDLAVSVADSHRYPVSIPPLSIALRGDME